MKTGKFLRTGTFAIDIIYKGKEFYALVIPQQLNALKLAYEVHIPWLSNFEIAQSRSGWKIRKAESEIDKELIELVGKEIEFVSTID